MKAVPRSVAELKFDLTRLERRLAFTEEWWSVRFDRIRLLAKERGCWPEIACIMANGKVDSTESSVRPDPATTALPCGEMGRLLLEIEQLRLQLATKGRKLR